MRLPIILYALLPLLTACINELPSNEISADMISLQEICITNNLTSEIIDGKTYCIFQDGSYCNAEDFWNGACRYQVKSSLETLEIWTEDYILADSLEVRMAYEINQVSPIFNKDVFNMDRSILFTSPLKARLSAAAADRHEIVFVARDAGNNIHITGTIARIPVKLAYGGGLGDFSIRSAIAIYDGNQIILDAKISLI